MISSKSLYFNKDMSIRDKINEHDLLAKDQVEVFLHLRSER